MWRSAADQNEMSRIRTCAITCDMQITTSRESHMYIYTYLCIYVMHTHSVALWLCGMQIRTCGEWHIRRFACVHVTMRCDAHMSYPTISDTHESWVMSHDSWLMTHDSWLMPRDSWLMTHDLSLMTTHMQMTCNDIIFRLVVILINVTNDCSFLSSGANTKLNHSGPWRTVARLLSASNYEQLLMASSCHRAYLWQVFRQKLKNPENSHLPGFELRRPSSMGTKLLLQVIKEIINQSTRIHVHIHSRIARYRCYRACVGECLVCAFSMCVWRYING